MAVSLKHTTVAVGTDYGNGEIGKAQWNEEHQLVLATDKLLGRASAGTGAVEEIACTATGRALIAQASNTEAANSLDGLQLVTTSGGTTTLTATSPRITRFSGSTTHTVVLPDVTTLALGAHFMVINQSTGTVTVNSSGGNTIFSVASTQAARFTCIATTGTGTTSWSPVWLGGTARTGTGFLVYQTSPTLTTASITVPNSLTVTAGTNAQGQGALTSDINVITTTANNPSGVTLPASPVSGRPYIIVNKGTNPVNVYAASGYSMNALAGSASVQLPVNGVLFAYLVSSTVWAVTFGAVNAAAAYTVSTLPTAGVQGRRAWVTDATAPTFLGTLTGGGTVVCPVFDNGTAWVAG